MKDNMEIKAQITFSDEFGYSDVRELRIFVNKDADEIEVDDVISESVSIFLKEIASTRFSDIYNSEEWGDSYEDAFEKYLCNSNCMTECEIVDD